MFQTINQKFYGIVGMLLIVFCITSAEVAYFQSKQSQIAIQGQKIVGLERDVRTLMSHFFEMRFWARAVFTQEFSDAEQRFGSLMAQLKSQLAELQNQYLETGISAGLDSISELLSQYEVNFNRLIQINTEQRLQITQIDSSYQSLASSILSIRDPGLLKPLFVLTQFQMNYVDHRRESEYQALQLVIESLKTKLSQAAVLDERLRSYLGGYRRILEKDVALDRLFVTTSARFNETSALLADLFSAITRDAKKLLQNEYARADRTRRWLKNSFLISMGASLVAILFVISLVARKIVQPVRSVGGVIQNIKAGKMTSRFDLAGDPKDEFIQLGLTLNEMLDTLEVKSRQVLEYQQDLEAKVMELALRESERETLIDELEIKNAELERFTYTVSHDLKSPLITIQGFLGFLEKDVASGNLERVQADCARITSATAKMQQLLSELLELSRIGRLINPPEKVPFEEIVRDALETVSGRMNAQNIRIEIDPNLPTVNVDRQRIREVVENLLDNAGKYMDSQADPRIEVGCRKLGDETVFHIRDNGMGIEPAFQDKIFGLFEKLNPSVEGSGVGLAIVKRIIEVHGGRIWVESQGAGRGSTFYFTLPPASP